MSDTTPNIYDQHNKPEAPEGKRAEWVKQRRLPGGTMMPARWRFVPIKRVKRGADQLTPRDPVSHRRPGPVAGKPRMTSPAHAEHLRQRLDVPITFITTLMHSADWQDSSMSSLLSECHAILKMAQLFIGRFTTNKDMSE